MDATTSRSRKKKRAIGEDIISGLPDHILLYILSFLPTTSAVATSVLSKRWEYLWTSIANLELRCEVFRQDSQGKRKFMDFVDTVLTKHDMSVINKFNFKCWKCDGLRFFKWMSKLINHNVQELILFFTLTKVEQIPLHISLFSCESVTKLQIFTPNMIEVPTLVSFPNVKILDLNMVAFHREDLTPRVFFDCPVLEEFTLHDLYWENISNVIILARKLKRLSIFDSGFYSLGNVGIEVGADSLISIEFMSAFAHQYFIYPSPSLTDVKIGITEYHEIVNESYVDLLIGMRDVKDLTLGFDTIQIFSCREISHHLLELSGLTRLSFSFVSPGPGEFPEDASGKQLIEILCNTPNIESLGFPDGLDVYPFKERGWTHGDNHKCLLPRLKILELGRFTGEKNQFCLVKFFLKNVSVLEKMNIKIQSRFDQKEITDIERKRIAKRLLKLARRSTCVIEFT